MAGIGKKPSLGRGFNEIVGGQGVKALLGEVNTSGSSSMNEIELSKIRPNPDQPRSIFDEEALEELTASIRYIGIIQPITVREVGEDSYVIISGERRYRASLRAGLTHIPAYVKTAADENIMEMGLIENIQREDLNAIEIALAYQRLVENYGLTQEKLSERVGKKRTTITNYLRLLKLPAEIQMGLKDKKIDMGHARALIPVEDPEVQLALYEQILSEGLSVRMVEESVRAVAAGEDINKRTGVKDGGDEVRPKPHSPKFPEEYKILKDHLSRVFSTKVQMTYNDGKGKISIPFSSEDDLERMMGLFDKLMRK